MSDAGLSSLPEATDSKPLLTVVQSAGGQLAAARIQAGLSVQQVAEQLKLSPRQIAALEGNQFDLLPKMVIVRGFVRSYAKLLKLDADPVLASLPQESGVPSLEADFRPTLATPFMESRTPFLGRQDTHSRKYLIGAALFAVLALLFLIGQKVEQSEYIRKLMAPSGAAKVAVISPEAGSASMPETSVQQLPPPVAVVASPAPSQVAATEMRAADMTPTAPHGAIGVASDATAAATSVAQASPALIAPESVNNSLRLKFRQDSWIQIKRDNGGIVTSHLARAGTEEVFDVKESLQIRIGNAAGVDAWLRGAALEIPVSKESNVANLSVK